MFSELKHVRILMTELSRINSAFKQSKRTLSKLYTAAEVRSAAENVEYDKS